MLPNLPEAPDVPGLFDAIGLEAAKDEIRRHIHHCWSRLGQNPFFFFFFLNSFCHRNAANQGEPFGATKKIISLATREITFG